MPKRKQLVVVKNASTHAKMMEAAGWSSIQNKYFREHQADPVSQKVLGEAALVLLLNVQTVIKKSTAEATLEAALEVALEVSLEATLEVPSQVDLEVALETEVLETEDLETEVLEIEDLETEVLEIEDLVEIEDLEMEDLVEIEDLELEVLEIEDLVEIEVLEVLEVHKVSQDSKLIVPRQTQEAQQLKEQSKLHKMATCVNKLMERKLLPEMDRLMQKVP